MANDLNIAIQISKTDLAKQFATSIKKLKDINTLQWAGYIAEKGPVATKALPDIIMIDDQESSGNLLSRVQTIRDNFPKSTIFVVSENKDPQYIIATMKAGAAEYLVVPVNEKLLIDAIEEVRTKLVNDGQIAQGRIYSFISAKGGVGSTVLAVNTAASMAMSGRDNVALLDMCFQSGDASVLLDIVPQNTILEICANIHRFDVSFLRGVMAGHSSGINFLPAPVNPEDSEDITNEHVGAVLNLAKKLYDHVVVDCTSMNVNDCSIEAFHQSDKVFVVTDMSVPAIRNTVRLCKLIQKVGISRDKIEVIVNRFIKGGTLSLSQVEKSFDKPVYWLVPNDFSDIVSSINRGVPLVKLSPGAPFSKNVADFIKKIQGLLDDSEYRGIRGTFGRTI